MISSRHPVASLFLAGLLLLPAGGAFAQTTPGADPGADRSGSMQAPADLRPQSQASASGKTAKPSGGCLKYGAAGAVGGHLAHHHAVLGAVGGCAVGAYVKHRSRKRIAAAQQP